ncbi:MAG: RsmE family RNA methyltransferase [Acidobacteriota bacterium]
MNLLLLEAAEVGDDGRVELAGRRAEHLRKVLKVGVGDAVRAGVIDGARGTARVASVAPGAVAVVFEPGDAVDDGTDGDPLESRRARRPPLDLLVALPRPQVLHRVLQTAAVLGVRRLDLVNAWRVEKSYFQSPSATPERIRRELRLGAEQGMTTRLPVATLHPRLLPALERLASEQVDELCLLAHPNAPRPIEDLVRGRAARRPVRLAIGPEGGWVEREVATFRDHGFDVVDLGPWVLRVEFAVAAALAQIDLLRRSGPEGGGSMPW